MLYVGSLLINAYAAMTTTKINKTLYVDMDGVLADFWTRLVTLRPELQGIKDGQHDVGDYVDYLLEKKVPNIFSELDPIEGAVESFQLLASVYDTYLLSTPSWVAPQSYTHKREWVAKHLGDAGHKRLILSHNKGLVKGHYLIDDRIAHGVNNFEGEHIHFRTEKFPDWESVVSYLRTKDNW